MILRQLLLACFMVCGLYVQAQTIYYVKEGGDGSGTSWNNAAGSLQKVIDRCQVGDRVYVAKGYYYASDGNFVEDERGMGTNERQKSFVIKSGVEVYGGFSGTDMSETPETREKSVGSRYGWQFVNATILTGTRKTGGTTDNWHFDSLQHGWVPSGYLMDNSLHVVWFATGGFKTLVIGEATEALPLSEITVLDGFVIEGGAADGDTRDGGIQGHSARFGGGVYLVEKGVLRNCIVRDNYAQTRGGGVYLNSGGLVSDCSIERNASPGSSANRNGFGGGLYMLGRGKVERGFMVNNSARIGGGLYMAKDQQVLPYEMLAEMSIVANNSAVHEAGGVYCDKGGVLTGLTIVYNHTLSVSTSVYGKAGGLFCNEYGVISNSVLWGNSSSSGGRQFFGNNVTGAMGDALASVLFYYSAIQNQPRENFGNASLVQVVNIDDNVPSQMAYFKRVPAVSGVFPGNEYLKVADWDKDDCSVFLRNGMSQAGAPSLALGVLVQIPPMTIDGKKLDSRPDIGSYLVDKLTINHATVNGKKVVYVDKQAAQCGDGSSWSHPVRFLQSAIDYVSEQGGGQVWVKEGTFVPHLSGFSLTDPQMYTIVMRSGVEVYGGFPQAVPSPEMADRNPSIYRTVVSGDIGIQGDYSDNSYHLMLFDTDLTAPSVLDGFTLMHANGFGDINNHGGAVWVKSSFAELRNCMIENNMSRNGAAVWGETPFRMTSCVVNNNEVTEWDAAAMVLAPGSELMNLTVVLNKGIGVSLLSGKITNTVLWGNTGNAVGEGSDNVQVKGSPIIAFSALSNSIPDNIYLSKLATGENAPNFSNPTGQAGVIPHGINGTLLGGPAIFEPSCISALIDKGTKEGAPLLDITGREQDVNFGVTYDIGAYHNTCLPGNSKIRYVKRNGTGRGFSWSDASGDLYAMIGTLQRGGGEVWVAAGTYTTAVGENLEIIEGVNVYGGFPNFGTPGMKERRPVESDPHYRTILQAQPQSENTNVGRVLTQTGDFIQETTWDGFTLQNGSVRITSDEDGGAGVKLMKGGRLVNMVVQNNINEVSSGSELNVRGGGVFNAGGTLINCHIRDNQAVGMMSAWVGGTSNVYGAGLYMTSGTAYNCVISNNTLTANVKALLGGSANAYGAGVYVNAGTFFNNTITKNSATSSSGLIAGSASSASGVRVENTASIVNCIVYGNTGTAKQITGDGTTSVSYSCTGESYPGEGNMVVNPQFVNVGGNDFHLQEGSPMINVGNTYPSGFTLPETDMDYTARIKDCAVDIGAYEYGGGREKIVPGGMNGKQVVYVTRDGAGSATGVSWEQAACATKLQVAIDYLSENGGGEVWVAVGMDAMNRSERIAYFYPTAMIDDDVARSNVFAIRSDVRVIGGFRGDEQTPDDRILGRVSSAVTVLNGDISRTPGNLLDDAYHVVVINGNAILEGFTIMNGNSSHYIDVTYQNGGGCLIRKGGVLRNCYIKSCKALNKGGGIYIEEGGTMSGCVVTENEAFMGGGIFMESNSRVVGSTIVKNKATKGGGVNFMFPIVLDGSVLWHNTASDGKDIVGRMDLAHELEWDGGKIITYPVNYSAIENIQPYGDGNIKLYSDNDIGENAPRFIDPENADFFNNGWSLNPTSSLIDRGLNAEIPFLESVDEILRLYKMSERDLAGNIRIRTVSPGYEPKIMDIGAYESDTVVSLAPMCKDGICRLYVTAISHGKTDGSSWANGTDDLQEALNYFKYAKTKGEVWVQGGYTYVPYRLFDTENQDQRKMSFTLNPYVSIYGGFKGDAKSGAGMISEEKLEDRVFYDRNQNGILENFEFRYQTILDGMINPAGQKYYSYHVLYYNAPTALEAIVVDGFTVTNGVANGSDERERNGGGVYSNAPVKVKNCIFYANVAVGFGGAAYLTSTTGKSMIVNSSFGGNESEHAGGAVALYNGVMVNTNLFNNTAKEMGGGIYAEQSELLNSSIVRNISAQGAGVYVNGGSMTNTVVWGNEGGMQVAVGTPAEITYSAVQDGEGVSEDNGAFNIRLNRSNRMFDGPRFIAPSEYAGIKDYDWMANWMIPSFSPLIDKGDNTAYLNEYPQTVYQLLYEGISTPILVNRVENEKIDIGTYEYKRVSLAENLNRMYVRTWESNILGSDGSSWAKATSDLQGAIEAMERSTASGVKEIWVAEGEYIPTKAVPESVDTRDRSFMITKGGVNIYGGFPDDGTGLTPALLERNIRKYRTVLNGNRMDNYHVVRIEGTDAVILDGFVIRGGKSSGDGSWNDFGSGAWIKNPSALVNHCVFTGNEGQGGALFMNGVNMRVENSLFYGNKGRAVYIEDGHFLNNTVVNNTMLDNFGGMLIQGGEMRNNIVWGNEVIKQLVFRNSPIISSNAIGGTWNEAWSDGNNIHLDEENSSEMGPRFVETRDSATLNFELDCGSCLIDAGESVILTDDVDLATKQRVHGAGIDIGAYESLRGVIPTKPEFIGGTTTCQGTPLLLSIDNAGFSGTEVYWTRKGTDIDIGVNKNPVTISETLLGGLYDFQAVRVDMTTFCQSAPEDVQVTIYSSPTVVLSGSQDVCAGQDIELTFVPVPDVKQYRLYDGDTEVSSPTWGNGKVMVLQPKKGRHAYQLTAIIERESGEICESFRSDTVAVMVHDIPMLMNGGQLPNVVSGDVVHHVPVCNVPNALFTWSRPAVNENAASSGRDSIYEVLIHTKKDFSLATYNYKVTANGCTDGKDYPVYVNILQGAAIPVILSGYGGCGDGVIKIKLNPNLVTNHVEEGFVVYRDGIRFSDVTRNVTDSTITFSAPIGEPHSYEIAIKVKITGTIYESGKTPPLVLEAHPVVNPVNVNSGQSSYCWGNNVVLTCGRAQEYRIYGNGALLNSTQYNLVENRVTIYTPDAGEHRYGVVAIERHADGMVCESAPREVSVTITPVGKIVVTGADTVNSNEVTNLALRIVGNPAATSFVWEVMRIGSDVSVTGGELSGSVLAMTLVNLGTTPQQVVFRVHYPNPEGVSGCEQSALVTITVRPLGELLPIVPDTDVQSVCVGDAMVEIVYPLSGNYSVTGLAPGVSHEVRNGQVVIYGNPSESMNYMIISGGQIGRGQVTVKPTPVFKLGKRR